MSLISCETNFILTWSAKSAIAARTVENVATAFLINDTKLYVSVVNLSADDNANLLQKLESGFKRIISWSEY